MTAGERGWSFSHLDLELMSGCRLGAQRRRQRQQATLVHLEASGLVPADDVEGEGRAVGGRVPVCHQQLEDATAHRFTLLQSHSQLKHFESVTTQSS